MFLSPLRYPGGKNKLAKYIAHFCSSNWVNWHYVEPYTGGGAVALHLLFNNIVNEITINDYDKSIYAFWYCVLNETEKFCRKIQRTEITLKNWDKFKKIQKNKNSASLFNLGFSTFFLNRTNVSGIIEGGMIWGREQKGKYKIDCRFNKNELIERIRKIATFKDKIHLYNMDALELVDTVLKHANSDNTIFYFDPPYYLHWPSLYMSHYKHQDHKQVSDKIKKIKNAHWVVSYDDTAEIRSLYKDCKIKDYAFNQAAYRSRLWKEVLFFSEHSQVPTFENPTKF